MAKVSGTNLGGGSGLGGFGGFGGKTPSFSVGGLGAALSGLTGGGGGGEKKAQYTNYTFKGKVNGLQVFFPGEEPVDLIAEAIQRITITKDYDEAIHPICEVELLLPPLLHDNIVKNKENTDMKFRLQVRGYDASNSFVVAKDFINDKFAVRTDDEAAFKERDQYESTKAMTGFNVSDYNTPYLLSLWRQHDLDCMRNVVNGIYENSTISTALNKIFTDAGVDKVLISPMDNEQQYGEIVLPPINLMNIPEHFERVYGMYYTGTQMFYDYRCMYILSKNGVCDAYEKEEWKRTIIIVKKSNKTESYRVGTSEDPEVKMYYVFTENDNVDIQSNSGSNDLIDANNVTTINPKNNETNSIEGAGSQRGSGNHKVVSENYGNPYNKTTILSDINEKKCTAQIMTFDFNPEAFTPNKEFVLVFQDTTRKRYNGFYRLTATTIIFGKKGADLSITGQHNFVFKAPIEEHEADAIISSVTSKFIEDGDGSTGSGTENTSGSSSNSSGGGGSGTSNRRSNILNPFGIDAIVSKNATVEENVRTVGKIAANDNEYKVTPPKPRFKGQSDGIVKNFSITELPAEKNPNYLYDDYGNVLGANIPDYAKITGNDDDDTIKAKRELQESKLPCEGPRPKNLNF